MVTATLLMDDTERTGRRFAMPHNAAALRALADRIELHAAEVREAANLLETTAPGMAVGLNFMRAVDAGLTAIRNVVHEVQMKVDNKKFIKIHGLQSEAPAAPAPKRKPKK